MPQSYLALPKSLLGNILMFIRPELVPSPCSVCYKEGGPKAMAEELPHWLVLFYEMFLGQSLHVCHSVEVWNGLKGLKWGIGKKRELCLPTAPQKSPHPKVWHLIALVSFFGVHCYREKSPVASSVATIAILPTLGFLQLCTSHGASSGMDAQSK